MENSFIMFGLRIKMNLVGTNIPMALINLSDVVQALLTETFSIGKSIAMVNHCFLASIELLPLEVIQNAKVLTMTIPRVKELS